MKKKNANRIFWSNWEIKRREKKRTEEVEEEEEEKKKEKKTKMRTIPNECWQPAASSGLCWVEFILGTYAW